MSQSAYSVSNSDGATFRAALNTLFAAIQSCNSGSTAPATTTAYMLWADTSSGIMKQRNAANSGWVNLFALGGSPEPTGTISPYAGKTAPTGFLLCDGSAVSRTTYADLYGVLAPSLGAVTITIATPGVVTLNAHGMADGDRIRLTTTGALPTGLTANTDYFLVSTSTNTFSLATTQGGAAIATSGTQSGTHTAQYFPYGAGDGSTTFNVPDLRGRALVGRDNMGGTAASRVTAAGSGIYGAALGASGGADTHTLTLAQMPSHSHTTQGYNTGSVVGSSTTAATGVSGASPNSIPTNTQGSGTAHNNMQPSAVINYLIKT